MISKKINVTNIILRRHRGNVFQWFHLPFLFFKKKKQQQKEEFSLAMTIRIGILVIQKLQQSSNYR